MEQLSHVPQSALAVAAHPDDIEFMAGGTLATWIAQGCRVHYLLVTDGAGGSRDPEQSPAALAAARRAEQREAARRLGVASVTFLGQRDAEVEANHSLRLAIARVIRQVRPEAVLSFDPHLHYRPGLINHPDHLAVGTATLGAVMPLANTLLAAPQLAEEGLAPHDVSEIYLFEAAIPSCAQPLSRAALERKHWALQAHASQLATWDGVAACGERTTTLAREAGQRGIACEHAELFARIQLSAPSKPAEPVLELRRPRAAVPLFAS